MKLLHFTSSSEAINNILTHGFVYVAHPTKVASFVLPPLQSMEREPQQFGMICFRKEMQGEMSQLHRTKFGGYAIAIDETWAISAGAQPVMYLQSTGATAHAFKRLLSTAAAGVAAEEKRFPGDSIRTKAYHNRAMASVFGAPEWAALLEIYQFLAPASDEWEREWRIVNPYPIYSIPKTGPEAVAQVSPPLGWAKETNLLKLPRHAVLHLVAPAESAGELRCSLPDNYVGIEIVEA
ncbi:MAG: abortive infection system antitoxin AbiGi family protein [Lacunisphaera sp.]